MAGLHRSPFKGLSTEFADHRDYTPGDDPRHIDWRAYARSDRMSVKRYEDETNFITYIAIDVSPSMRYRGPEASLSKFEYAQCLAAALSWLVLDSRNAVAMTSLGAEEEIWLAPGDSEAQLTRVIQTLEAMEAEKGVRTLFPPRETAASFADPQEKSPDPFFARLDDRFRRRGVVVILSDMLDDADGWLTALRLLKGRRHDIVVFQTLDPAELDLPLTGVTQFDDLEGAPTVVADAGSIRCAYRHEITRHCETLRRGCLASEIDFHMARTDMPLDEPLRGGLSRQQR